MPPRPRFAKPVAAAVPSSSSSVANASSPINNGNNTDDEDDHFIVKRGRSANGLKALQKRAEGAQKSTKDATRLFDDDDDDDYDLSPRKKQRAKESVKTKPLPSWTSSKGMIDLLSSAESDSDDDIAILSGDDDLGDTPKASKSKKRPRSRSRSITPPPALDRAAVQRTRNLVRQTLDGDEPHAAARTTPPRDGSDSSDVEVQDDNLDPELASIMKRVYQEKSKSSKPSVKTGGPEIVKVTVKWLPHPLDETSQVEMFNFQVNRNTDFGDLFEEIADCATVLSSDIVVSHGGLRIFQSSAADSLNAWADLELEACHKNTWTYRREHRNSATPAPEVASEGGRARSQSVVSESDAEGGESEKTTFKLILRSATTKDVSVTVRPTTTCGAIVKAFLKKSGLLEVKALNHYAGARLVVDGDRLDPESQIAEADLDDGDMLEVLGF